MEIQPLYCLFTIGILIYFIRTDSYFYNDFIYFWKHDEEKGG